MINSEEDLPVYSSKVQYRYNNVLGFFSFFFCGWRDGGKGLLCVQQCPFK